MIEEANKTVWCGNLSEQVTEELLYELFVQVRTTENITDLSFKYFFLPFTFLSGRSSREGYNTKRQRW